MISLKRFFPGVICVLGLACIGTLLAEPVKSPLAVTPDLLGAELQRTFISAPGEIAAQTRGSFLAYRKTFSLAAVPLSAKLHCFADARYLLWLNGQPVHRGPNRFEIRGPEYDTLELASALRAGSNTLVVVVMGNGGAIEEVNDGMGNGHNARMMRHVPGLTVRLDVDGRPVLRTDETWKWSDHTRYRPAKVDWAKIVDRINTRAEDGDWTQPDYDDRAWQPAVKIDGGSWGPLSARRIPLLRDKPVAVGYSDNVVLPLTLTAGRQLKFSTGRLVQAYTVLTLEAGVDTELTLNYAGIDYIARAGRQVYISSDTCAFYDGVITVKSGRATILDLQLVERLYPFDVDGSFKSSDPLLNHLWNVCTRSLQILSEDAYVDCADRERAEWMDCDPPAFDLTRTAMSAPGPDAKPHYADARLLGEMLRRTALTQQSDGWVKAHTTSDRFDTHAKMEDRACDWVQGARRYYESTGDTALIREIWPVIISQLEYFLARRTTRGLVLGREWVVWGNPVGYVTCEGAGLNAFVYKALMDASILGRAIGEEIQGRRFERAAQELAEAFNAVLWDEEAGTYFSGYLAEKEQSRPETAKLLKLRVENQLIEPTMFSALWALDQGIVPENRLARVTQYLFDHRPQAKRMMTFYYLFHQLYAANTVGFDREILETFRQKWRGMTDAPWQTSWEEFEGGSKAHVYGLFPGYFLSAYVLGVRRDGPVWNKHLIIEPHLGGLTSVEGTVVTEYGPVPVAWRLEPGALTFQVEVPLGVAATLRVPKPAANAVMKLENNAGEIKSVGDNFIAEIGAGAHRGTITFATDANHPSAASDSVSRER